MGIIKNGFTELLKRLPYTMVVEDQKYKFDFSHLETISSFQEREDLAKKFIDLNNKLVGAEMLGRHTATTEHLEKAGEDVLEELKKHPELMKIVWTRPGKGGLSVKETLPMVAAGLGFRGIAEYAMEDESARRIQVKDGIDLGLSCAQQGWEDLAKQALQDKEMVSRPYIGVACAEKCMLDALEVAFDYPELVEWAHPYTRKSLGCKLSEEFLHMNTNYKTSEAYNRAADLLLKYLSNPSAMKMYGVKISIDMNTAKAEISERPDWRQNKIRVDAVNHFIEGYEKLCCSGSGLVNDQALEAGM